jgi:hypothetical protein
MSRPMPRGVGGHAFQSSSKRYPIMHISRSKARAASPALALQLHMSRAQLMLDTLLLCACTTMGMVKAGDATLPGFRFCATHPPNSTSSYALVAETTGNTVKGNTVNACPSASHARPSASDAFPSLQRSPQNSLPRAAPVGQALARRA